MYVYIWPDNFVFLTCVCFLSGRCGGQCWAAQEILALREARQAEVHESFNRTKDHEEFAKQKEAEISTLQQGNYWLGMQESMSKPVIFEIVCNLWLQVFPTKLHK